jgi:hypothetical protein
MIVVIVVFSRKQKNVKCGDGDEGKRREKSERRATKEKGKKFEKICVFI